MLYILGKFYRGLLYTKLLFDQLPLFNPYKWPLSIIRILTDPWFRFWRKHFPPARVRGQGFDISGLIAFESLEIFLKFISFLKLLLLIRLQNALPN
uniref:Photosystem I assembly protein Ycf19 n=1 Tax=Poteriospumella lacustris TaxID=1117027 RepID=A0A7S6PV36_9STRA|nr:photosystem I assembly protein Ycf19 [Poteriospumella lacustris]